jgi:hypothetical protein
MANFLLYNSEDGKTQVRIQIDGETCWMSQKLMAELFETTVANINIHVKNILDEGELEATSVVKDYLITAADGKSYQTKHYRLEMVLAVGYRVRSPRGSHFRRWATEALTEYLIKGFVIDDERLKQGKTLFGKDYFDELLARIRDIRASERRFYQKITDIYATAIDYDPRSPLTQVFFATVQNKLEWAITGMTAAELIQSRADAEQPTMGLTTWRTAPVGPIRRADVTVAKNYLQEDELASLNRIVTMYLDYAEDQAQRQKPMTMQVWADKLDAFLEFNDRPVLKNAGSIQKRVTDKLALEQFDAFEPLQQAECDAISSDFDRLVQSMKNLPKPGEGSDDE